MQEKREQGISPQDLSNLQKAQQATQQEGKQHERGQQQNQSMQDQANLQKAQQGTERHTREADMEREER